MYTVLSGRSTSYSKNYLESIRSRLLHRINESCLPAMLSIARIIYFFHTLFLLLLCAMQFVCTSSYSPLHFIAGWFLLCRFKIKIDPLTRKSIIKSYDTVVRLDNHVFFTCMKNYMFKNTQKSDPILSFF
jgi:hypothetical protein